MKNAAWLKENKWVRRGIVALASLLVLWLVLWLAVPPIAKSQLQKIASEKLGRTVTVGKVDFKPWSLELTIDDLRIASAQAGAPPQLEVRRLYADAELQSVLRLAPVIDAVSIEGPTVRLAHLADGKYDIDDILARFAPKPDDPPPGEPQRFAVYNIAITGGSVDFDDQPVKRKHELRDFELKVPFVSNLASKREVKVEPKLAFVLNGSHFDSSAFSTPFADNRKTDAQLRFADLDLAPYLGYVPSSLPVKVLAGTLGADLKLDFERANAAALSISGTVEARNIKVADAQGRDLLGFGSLKIGLADVRPLDRKVHLGSVALADPQLAVARDAAGKLNLLATNPATGATEKVAPPAAAASAPAPNAPQPAGWALQVDKVALQGGSVTWRDETTQPAAAVQIKDMQVEASDIVWPMAKPARFGGSLNLAGAPFKFQGEGTDKAAQVQTEVEALPLSLAAPYLAKSLEPTLDGKLGGQVDITWAAPNLQLHARKVSVDNVALTQGKTALASAGRFEIADAKADLTAHTLAIGSFTATNPKVRVERDGEKRWMFERWMRTPAGGGDAPVAAPKSPAAEAAPGSAKPWQLSIATLAVDNGAVSYADQANASTPVEVEITALKLKVNKLAPDTATVSPVELSGRIGAGRRADPGRFDFKGQVVLKPLSAEGRLETSAIPSHAFKAYYADTLNVDIRRSYTNYRGTVRFAQLPAGISLKLAGDTAIEDFRANSATLTQKGSFGDGNQQLLSWKALSLRGLQVDLSPGAPLKVDVRETTLTDVFARIIVEESGRLNLQGLTKKGAEESAAAGADASRQDPATRRQRGGGTVTTNEPAAAPARPVSAEEMVGGAPPAASTAQAARPGAAPDPMAPVINFGPVSVVNGKVDFTDLFIKPNYSADLSELTGKLSAFSSTPKEGQPTLADLELRGKAQQTASLEITGKLNPLAKPLELDITAKMRDLDLPPLSPYSVRYAGHGIERGKLSLDVNYKVAPDGRLTATNNLVLNQLQFGEEVKGAPNSLPVRLAVALLADRNGVIDVDLPLSGSLNDPQFSVGPLIWKAVLNLITKAITAPFSLLTGGLGGGGGDSSVVPFDLGSSTLTPAATQSLDKVVKALNDRPALRMTVVGVSSFEKEREAYKRQRLRQLAQAEKRRVAVRAGQDPAQVAPVTDAEYPKLLEAVYKRADITKPRNMIGLAKDLPTDEMEKLLLASIPVDEQAIRELAVARGAAVRDYLLEHKLASDRLFLGAVRTDGGGADWKPGAELKLDTR
ncbi:MAG: DUF748 domain-containing protein [Proteobacteria bacterium]|nr:DUF748 domain-containing protein [Pseudomonadota bacterium]